MKWNETVNESMIVSINNIWCLFQVYNFTFKRWFYTKNNQINVIHQLVYWFYNVIVWWFTTIEMSCDLMFFFVIHFFLEIICIIVKIFIFCMSYFVYFFQECFIFFCKINIEVFLLYYFVNVYEKKLFLLTCVVCVVWEINLL